MIFVIKLPTTRKLNCAIPVIMGWRLLTGLVLSGVSLMNLVVKPHVGHSHAVLRQGSGFIWANGGCWAQSLYSLQIFYQAIFPGHALCRQGQTHLSDKSEEELVLTVWFYVNVSSICIWYMWLGVFIWILTVTVASSPSGTLATMIPIRKMTASSQL